jgi:hypothetical protein
LLSPSAPPTTPPRARRGMARKDLERILAEDSTFEGVKERLAELSD